MPIGERKLAGRGNWPMVKTTVKTSEKGAFAKTGAFPYRGEETGPQRGNWPIVTTIAKNVFQNARVFAPKAVEGGQVRCRSAGPRKLAHSEHDILMQKHPKNDRRGESGER